MVRIQGTTTGGQGFNFVMWPAKYSFGYDVGEGKLKKAFEREQLSTEDVAVMSITSLEGGLRLGAESWGPIFDGRIRPDPAPAENFPNLTSLMVSSGEFIHIDPHSFYFSSVQFISLRAPKLWLNDGAFFGAPQLETVVWTAQEVDGQQHGGLAELLFQDCPKLRAVYGTYRGQGLMPQVFFRCSSLVQPPQLYVECLGSRSFAECFSLKQIHLHNGLKDLGYEAFQGCTSLEDIYIPDTVVNLGHNTFEGCSSLRTIHLPKRFSCIRARTFAGCGRLKKVFLSDELERIEQEAFLNCASLGRPWLPDKLLSIGTRAFCGCTSMREVYLPESLTEIGEDAFSNCGNLTIHGKAGTLAEQYAAEHGIAFVAEQDTEPAGDSAVDLSRFTQAHRTWYQTALSELKSGRKSSHWMWFMFPLVRGAARSETSQVYSLGTLDEAAAFLQDPYLGGNLRALCSALLALETNNAKEVFERPDDWKLHSCMTLFALLSERDSLFRQVLDKFFDGRYDSRTLGRLRRWNIHP